MRTTLTTASSLKAILAFIDPDNTPKIAYDRDDMAIPLADKIKYALGDRDGSQSVSITFNSEDDEILRQFNGVCSNIESVFSNLSFITS